jgi:hypothetical protein
VARALRAPRRDFTISKFSRHEDGYLHARVVVGGRKFYFNCQFGSWLAPGRLNGQPIWKEPEALLGPIGTNVKFALAERARERRWHYHEEEHDDDADDAI